MPGQWVDHNGTWMWDYSYQNPQGYQESGSTQNPPAGQYDYNGEPLPTWQGQEGQPASATAPGTAAYQQQQQAQAAPPAAQPAPAAQAAPDLGTAPPPGNGLTATQQSAKASLDNFLGQYGLQSLGDYAWGEYLNGVPVEQIMLDIRSRPEYTQRFPGMAALASKGQAISEAQYIDLERSYTQAYRQAGLPTSFYDSPEDFGALIGNNVSPNELGHRLDLWSQMTYASDPEVTRQLKSLYGLTDGDILAYTIDPTKALPILQKQYQAAQESAAGVLSGFGALNQSEAERLALLGVSTQQAMSGFAQLGQEKELFQSLPGEAGMTPITREEELGAEFQGNAPARQRIENQRAYRLGQFQGGGGYSTSNKGVAGVAAPQT